MRKFELARSIVFRFFDALYKHGVRGTARLAYPFFEGFWQSAAIRRRARALKRAGRGPVVLVARRVGLGDVIGTFPTVLALRQKHPGCYLIYGTASANIPAVEMANCADEVVPLNWWNPTTWLRKCAVDFVYQPTYEDEDPRGTGLCHSVDDFAARSGVALADRQPRIPVPVELQRSCRERLRAVHNSAGPVVVFHVGPTEPYRVWSAANWATLAQRLRDEFDATILQLGVDHFRVKGKTLVPRIAGTIDLVGKLSLRETIGMIAVSDLLVGIDSGLLHIAGAVETPGVGIFGAVDPRWRLPPSTPSLAATANLACLGCHHQQPRLHWVTGCPHDLACMQQVDAEAVFHQVQQLLQQVTPRAAVAADRRTEVAHEPSE